MFVVTVLGGEIIFFTTHTHTDQRQNYPSVLIHRKGSRVVVWADKNKAGRSAPATADWRRPSSPRRRAQKIKMSVLRAQTAVIGAGVVGLAVARALAASGREVIIIESEDAIGTGSSSRNSEVVHAGIYYARGSLKARACVEGRRLLYTYCAERGVEHRRCGKLLVATHDDELPALTSIAERARANGLERADEELRVVSPREVAEMEPHVRCVGALHSPSTGIVDSHALMLALLGDAQSDGAELALGTRIMAAEVCVPEPTSVGSGGPTASGPRSAQSSMRMLLHTDDGTALGCDEVVNCAGHGAPELARVLAGMPQEHVPTAHFAKGVRAPHARPTDRAMHCSSHALLWRAAVTCPDCDDVCAAP
jgi:glycine/D-amino acid oxidase-like deaminating enzyme